MKRPRPSSFAMKQVMAVTGFIFVAFVFIHMIGNLKVFQGPEAFNGYATWLREVGYPLVPKQGVLWALRVVLAGSLLAHMWAALVLWARGRKARGSHRRRGFKTSSAYGALLMLPTGLITFVFIVVHLLDLTIGALLQTTDFRHAAPDGTAFAYENLVASFSRPWMAAFYIVVMVLLAIHIEHGWRTMLQDIGATGRRFRKFWTSVGGIIALVIVIANGAIPALVLAGVIA